LVVSQVLQNAPPFAVYSGSCSETEVSEQLYLVSFENSSFYKLNKFITLSDNKILYN
jgi:hypothetical protein